MATTREKTASAEAVNRIEYRYLRMTEKKLSRPIIINTITMTIGKF
jgi:hypothetical protein